MSRSTNKFLRQVLKWGRINFRPFPWRFDRTPYKVLVAEFLLQKTDAQKVTCVFGAVIKRYPNLKALSKADESELRNYIGGLGLAYRSKRMIEAAETFMNRFGGRIPCSYKALLSAKGIGKYMANAVLCFGFETATPILDTNVARILIRYWGVQQRTSRCREDSSLWRFAGQLVPNDLASDYNYALLDLGALVCHARKPDCLECPLNRGCIKRIKMGTHTIF